MKEHAELWKIYGPGLEGSPVENHPIAFIARAKNEIDAQTTAAGLRELRYEIISVEKKWWPRAPAEKKPAA